MNQYIQKITLNNKKINSDTKKINNGIWVSRKIWKLSDLNTTNKLFLARIEYLQNINKCVATNADFAKFFNLKTRRINYIIEILIKKELIKRQITYKQNSKQIKNRVLQVNYIAIKKNDLIKPILPICFLGIYIPHKILQLQNISVNAKIILAIIAIFNEKTDINCYATNDYFAIFLNLKIRKIQRIIKSLLDLKIITKKTRKKQRILTLKNNIF